MSAPGSDPDIAELPEDLPRVQPPSAGFIVQLFVIPFVIVAAIVGVWLLFGKLATGENDWRGLVIELQHNNPHRRWRAALGLAQLLNSDQRRGGEGQQLATNREMAAALADVLKAELERGGQTEKELNYQAFVARTLGLFDLPDAVFPALQQAMQPEVDREVRKNAVGSIAVMTDRMATAGSGSPSDLFASELITVSTDADPLIRRLAAYSLGLFPQVAARERLEVLLDDTDADTRINAAIALARSGDTEGMRVFRDVLKQAFRHADPKSDDEYEQFVALKNALAAIEKLASQFSAGQRQELIPLIQPIADDYREAKIRTTARSALLALQAVKSP